MATNSTSFNNTPQATDDYKTLTESQVSLGSIITLDVLSNDLGGNAKKLWSVDADAETWDALKNSDKVNVWEYGANGNGVRINADSTISYQLNSIGAGRTIDSLYQGETFTDTVFYTIRLANGTLSKAAVTVTIVGENDKPVVKNLAVSVVEDAMQTGQLSATDADMGDSIFTFATVGPVPAGFSLLPSGAYTIDATNAAYQHLAAGATQVVTVNYTATDAYNGTSDAKTITITVTGVNDTASISGTKTGSLTEDDTTAATGTLTVSDVDDGEAFAQVASGTSTKGSYTVDANGNWSYTVNNAAAQHLAAGATDTDSFTVTSKDGTASETVVVTITGVNDTASISGTKTGSLTEDDTTAATGTLTVSDVDDGEAFAQVASGTSTKGSYTVDANGNWSYTVNNAAAQHLAAGATDTDSFTVTSKDGTASETVVVTITGVNDTASISGTKTGSVTEDSATLIASGTLTASDVDDGQAKFQTVTVTALQGVYGSFTFNESTGAWGYTLNNAAANVQALGATDHVTDQLVVKSFDGTATETITVTINGAADGAAAAPPVSSGVMDPNDMDTYMIANVQSSTVNFSGTGNINDTIYGSNSNDDIDGKNGGDQLYGFGGNDSLKGGPGIDFIYGGAGDDTIQGGSEVDTIYGGSGNDTIQGDANNDLIYGGSGNDTINGNGGLDTIIGGYGADILSGGGPDGVKDTFRFLSTSDTGDTISDFQSTAAVGVNHDVIDLDALGLTNSLTNGTTLTSHGTIWFYDAGTNQTIVQADTDGVVGTAEFQIQLTGNVTLQASDFVF